MYINPLQSSPLLAEAPTAGRVSANGNPKDANPLLSTDNLFLQLLTTQLKNQTPFDPMDPNQFTVQLVQMNMLDQLSQINQTLQQIAGTASSTNPASVQGAR